jgi:hypothetical protein
MDRLLALVGGGGGGEESTVLLSPNRVMARISFFTAAACSLSCTTIRFKACSKGVRLRIGFGCCCEFWGLSLRA